jgi:zinc protease
MRDDDATLANRFFDRAALAGHPYGRTALGTEASLTHISHADVTDWVAGNVVRERLVVGLAGDVTAERAHALAEVCAAGLSPGSARPAGDLVPPSVLPGRRTILVDKPERTQSQILIGHAAPPPTHPDFHALQVAGAAFGGGFTSRLMTEVRVKRGWSYSASFRTAKTRVGHTHRLWVFPSAEQTADTLALVLGMWEDAVAKGFSSDEVEIARSYLEGAFAFEIDTPNARLDRRIESIGWGLPDDFLATHVDNLRAVTPEQVNDALRRHWRPADAVITVMATAETMLPRLAGLPLGPVEVVAYDSY